MVTILDWKQVEKAGKGKTTPQTFMERCREIVISVSPANPTPSKPKHKVRDYELKTHSIRSKRSQRLPEWNETNVNRTETILGIVLVVIGFLLFKPSDVSHPDSWHSASSVEEQKVSETTMDIPLFGASSTENVIQGTSEQMPTQMLPPNMLSSQMIPPRQFGAQQFDSQQFGAQSQLSATNATQQIATFHSFTDPRRRFAFNEDPSIGANQSLSAQAAFGMANHLQSMQSMAKSGRHPIQYTHVVQTKQSQHHQLEQHKTSLLNHPTVVNSAAEKKLYEQRLHQMAPNHKMVRNSKAAFEHFVGDNRTNPGTAPFVGMMNRFRQFSNVLQTSCGPGPSGDAEE